MADIALLKVERGRIKGSLTKLKTFADSLAAQKSAIEIEIRLKRLNELIIEFKNVDDQLVLYDVESEFSAFEDKYIEAETTLRKHLLSKLEPSSPTSLSNMDSFNTSLTKLIEQQKTFIAALPHNGSSSSSTNDPVRLPKIDIPIFSGDYKDWASFKDLFESSVKNKDSLTNAMKLQFLKGALTGEPASLIKHLTITDGNFPEAWSKLVVRYEKKRQIVSEYIKTFMNQPMCNVSSRSGSYISTLRTLSDTSDQIIRGIKVLGEDASQRDAWLIYILLSKVDSETRRAWAESTSDEEFPKFKSFIAFLNNRCDALETFEPITGKSNTPPVVRNLHLTPQACSKCRQGHQLFKCPEYKMMKVSDKREFVKKNGLCFNCLTSGHPANKCNSSFRCHYCKLLHHSSLHHQHQSTDSHKQARNSLTTSKLSTETPPSNTSTLQSTSQLHSYTIFRENIARCTILPTALVRIVDANGNFQLCRILLDSGSQATFISEECVQRLGFKRQNARIIVHGLGSTKNAITRGKVFVTLTSRVNTCQLDVQAYILDKLTAPQPSQTFCLNIKYTDIPHDLADPHFYVSQKIDLILGAEHFTRVLQDGRKFISSEIPPLQNTIFGYIISGPMPLESTSSNIISCHADITDLDATLRKFWEIENVPEYITEMTDEEQSCESMFARTHSVDPINQRYIVKLPFKDDMPLLGNSLALATSCFKSLEHRLQSNPELHSSYSAFMKEYRELDHMEPIPDALIHQDCEHMYLPHHPVIKLSSTTTKVRVVFNGSARTSNGISLNQKLLVGPKIQKDLHQVLLTFRSFKIALVADIEKMYRQVLVEHNDRNYQRIIWRQNPKKPIQHFWLKTVTYGTSAAPYLAIRSLKQLAIEFKGQYSLAEKALIFNFYVDDLLGGASTEDEALTLHQELTSLLNKRGFSLRKWASNSSEVMTYLHPSGTDENSKSINEHENGFKVLGLKWNPTDDCFAFDVNIPEQPVTTKRMILSEISQIFDPLGLISPVIISFKILIQHLWLKQYGWDEHCSDIHAKWRNLRADLSLLHKLNIPRFINIYDSTMEIHGFADASQSAYAAVVYCRTTNRDNTFNVNIIASKTRICPIKQISIPRLELCAAVLLTRLMNYIKTTFSILDQACYAWTDSTIVLSWLSSPPRKWKCFVANRTSEILNSFPRSQWNHVSSADNPADLASRGVTTQQLINSSIWWQGPKWLQLDWKQHMHHHTPAEIDDINEEKRENYVDMFQVNIVESVLPTFFSRFSSLTTIIQILSRCFQFARRCRTSKVNNDFSPSWVISSDVTKAFNSCILWTQREAFHKEIKQLEAKHQLSSSSSLISLTPFLDEYGILRVGGRITNASRPFNVIHPIILPKNHIFTTYLIEQLHIKYLHAGLSLLLNIIRQRYWIISCRNLIKSCINKCIVCVRQRSKISQQIMADLPKMRVTACRAFENTGVDYAGPILLLNRRGRGSRTFKAYIVLFVCFSTRAIHIELAGDLTSETFIACLKRFSSRRGLPATIWSDNGTNFIGANRLLSEIQKTWRTLCQDEVTTRFIANNNIVWKFNPPAAPHFGGLWEAGVKSVKSILTRVIGSTYLTYEEMLTVLVQIEGLLNSRPLVPVNDDVTCLNALTPAHFLIGHPLTSVPELPIEQNNLSIRERWRITQRIQQDFWKRWHIEYISTLQRRPKWQQVQHNLTPGDMVLVKEPNLQPKQWMLGRVKDVHQGQDNLVRVVTVTTSSGDLRRPVTKICKLPINNC